MNTNLLFDFTVDKENKTIHVKREFAAPLDKVWAAWTQSELLDQWWGPKPWHVETKSMDFKNGGRWIYAMVSPEGERRYSLSDYDNVNPKNSFSTLNAFCDENGNFDPNMARSNWNNNFKSEDANTTLVDIVIKFPELEALEKYIAMGFKEGFSIGLGQLDDLLAK